MREKEGNDKIRDGGQKKRRKERHLLAIPLCLYRFSIAAIQITTNLAAETTYVYYLMVLDIIKSCRLSLSASYNV